MNVRKLLSLTVFFLVSSSSFAGTPPQELQRAIDDLEVIESLIQGKLTTATKNELQKRLDSVQLRLKELQDDMLRQDVGSSIQMDAGTDGFSFQMNVNENRPIAPPPPPEIGPQPMNSAQFSSLTGAINSEAFGDGKLRTLQSASSGSFFTSQQAKSLVSLYTFGDDKIEAAVMLYPRVLDPENFYIVYGAFNFESEKEEVRQRLGL